MPIGERDQSSRGDQHLFAGRGLPEDLPVERPGRFQKASALALWYQARTADGRASTRKTMIVALARKLLIGLWRFVTTGELLEGVILRTAG